ncbi:NUMOD4 domain-containing protein [Flavobacterium sp.]|uniref:NUMOD4 domain-containing protein n=1 Tax=Flavobacterium sp. TaxID=239 RepID=UPI0028BDC64D|nr:NUMOD4 domain-containing protein [Flavobacterium sp.]
MIRYYPNEVFKEFEVKGNRKKRYAISNMGRLMSFTEDISDGVLLKGALADGYRLMRLDRQKEGVKSSDYYMLYKLVADFFVPKTAENQEYVIHLDFTRDNDRASNLKWVTYEEKMDHYRKSPHVAVGRKRTIAHNIKSDGRKLTETTVIRLKKILLDPNRKTRMRILAKQFGVSEMQLYRIKSGENWGHIKVDVPTKKADE